MLEFKDKTIYEKCKYTIITKLLFKTEKEVGVEIEYLDKDSNWHLLMPYEHEFKKAEEEKDDIFLKFWGKYRKWQKRKIYNIEEFNIIFIN